MIFASVTTKKGEKYFPVTEYYNIYDYLKNILELDRTFSDDENETLMIHECAANAASWCELACVGETYEDVDAFSIEIVED